MGGGAPADTFTRFDSWSAYDAMNRQIVVDGVSVDGTITINADTGQRIAYDSAGNRLLVRQWGKQLVANTHTVWDRVPIPGSDEGGYEEIPRVTTTWGWTTDYGNETYGYDAAGRLTNTWRGAVNVQAFRYDRAGRVVQSSPSVAAAEFTQELRNAMRDSGISQDTQISSYSALGQLVKQTLLNPDGGIKTHLENHYNQLGQLTAYEQHIRGDGGYLGEFDLTYATWDPSKVTQMTGTRDGGSATVTTNVYDANGYQIGVNATGGDNIKNTRSLLNDAGGRVLRKLQDGHLTHTLIANGEVIGSSSDSGAAVPETFRSSFIPTNSASYTGGPQAYTVQLGDTLASIAKALWGNADLWYLIAEANGTSEVSPGNIITIPAKPNTVYNDFDTFAPYSASDAIGDATPILPVPQGSEGGCGGVGQILAIVVTIVLSYIAPWGSGIWAEMAYAAIGSTAGQTVAVVIGEQDSFNWKGVALSAISAGVGAGVGQLAQGTALAGQGLPAVARAAIGNAVTQGIGVATGLQDKFDWRSVAASAVGAGVGSAIGGELGLPANGTRPEGMGLGEYFGKTAAKSFAAGLTTAVMRGGKVAIQQVAVDAFGNALALSLTDGMSSSGSTLGTGDFSRMDGEGYRGQAHDGGAGWAADVATRAADRPAWASGGAGDTYFAPSQAETARSLTPMVTRIDNAQASEALAHRAHARVDDLGNAVLGQDGLPAYDRIMAFAPQAPGRYGYQVSFVNSTQTYQASWSDRPANTVLIDGDGGFVLPTTNIQDLGSHPESVSFGRQMYEGMNERLTSAKESAQDYYAQNGSRSSGLRYGLNAAAAVATQLFPGGVGEAATAAVGGPIIGRVMGWGSKAAVGAFPVLGREVGSFFGNVGEAATARLGANGGLTIATNPANGNPAAIARGMGTLNSRQAAVLDQLPDFGSRTITSKAFGQRDLAALTAASGDEFAMFSTGGRRLIYRGDATSVPINPETAQGLATQGWRWSSHVHPGYTMQVLRSSPGDRAVLGAMGGEKSAIFNSVGQQRLFTPLGDSLEGWKPW